VVAAARAQWGGVRLFHRRIWVTGEVTAMALKVELKPFERIIIGQSLITNCDTRTRLMISGEAPILREKDILTADTAKTPVKRLYLCVQMMYLEDDIPKYQDLYVSFVRDLLEAVPSFRKSIETASRLILSGSLYSSLKEIQKLIKREAELLKQVPCSMASQAVANG
jgi:flagellar protein FlbT